MNVKMLDTKQSNVPVQKRLIWREAKERDKISYRQCVDWELRNIVLPAEAAVCNEPESCDHRQQLQIIIL